MRSYYRFLSRNKLYTLISVVGLVVSLMFVILLGDYAWRQYSIDAWHRNAGRICLLGDQDDFFFWPQAAREVREMCPEVEQTCCVMSQNGRIKHGRQEVKNTGQENGIIMLADSTFFQFFDFELVEGDRRTALDAPDKCVVTERLARRLFGDKSPVGETLQIVGDCNVRINNEDPSDSTLLYTVSAVAKDLDRTVLPNETQVIASMERFPQVMGYRLSNDTYAYSGTGGCKAFVMLYPGTTLDGKKALIADHLAENYHAWGMMGRQELSVTPLRDVMFAPQNKGAGMQTGDKARLRILLAAVLAILFFAVSNYINLTVANTGFRAKEMATRRLFGSSQLRISLKLIAESTLMVALAFIIGFCLAVGLQDDASTLFKGKIALLSDIRPGTVGVCLAFILATGIVAGIMPSWQMARYQPIDIVKGNFRFHSKMVMGRLFIILQNVITVTMLTAALVIWLQLNHLVHAPLGFNSENVYSVFCKPGKSQAIRAKLEAMPCVEAIGRHTGTTFVGHSASMQYIKRGDDFVKLYLADLDSAAFRLYGLEMLKDYGLTDGGFYMTEEAMRQMGCTEEDREMDWGNGRVVPIAGIVKDFHRINVLQGYEPIAIRLHDDLEDAGFLVKTNGSKEAKTQLYEMMRELDVSEEEQEWMVSAFDDVVAQTFDDQRNTLSIITLFTLVAIVISVMGFVGLSLFFIRQRRKEVGIRKIMGSTSGEVAVLMLRTFCAPLLVSFVIAVPLSWYIMHGWLTNFSYRISLSPWIFAVVCLFTLLVAVLSVCIQIVRAVRTNPVESIKTE